MTPEETRAMCKPIVDAALESAAALISAVSIIADAYKDAREAMRGYVLVDPTGRFQ